MMGDYLRVRFGHSEGDRNATPDRGVDGVRRLRHQSGKFVEMLGAFERSYVSELNGKPYPVQWRSQGAEQAWAQAIGNTDVWRQWALRAPRAGTHGASRGRSRRSAARHKRGTVGGRGDTKKGVTITRNALI
jgi:hypothetical protein